MRKVEAAAAVRKVLYGDLLDAYIFYGGASKRSAVAGNNIALAEPEFKLSNQLWGVPGAGGFVKAMELDRSDLPAQSLLGSIQRVGNAE